MGTNFRILIICFGLFLGLGFCTTREEVSHMQNNIGDRDSGHFGVYDWEKSDEKVDASTKALRRLWEWFFNNLMDLDEALRRDKKPGDQHCTQESCPFDVGDVNWPLLALKAKSCIIRAVKPSLLDGRFCNRTDEIRSCLNDLLAATERLSVWSVYKAQLFRPKEILENWLKAFCSEEWSPQIINALTHALSGGGEAFHNCMVEQWGEWIERVELIAAYVVEEELESDDICMDLGLFGTYLRRTFRVCEDSELAAQYIGHIWELIMGLSAKCPSHPIF